MLVGWRGGVDLSGPRLGRFKLRGMVVEVLVVVKVVVVVIMVVVVEVVVVGKVVVVVVEVGDVITSH